MYDQTQNRIIHFITCAESNNAFAHNFYFSSIIPFKVLICWQWNFPVISDQSPRNECESAESSQYIKLLQMNESLKMKCVFALQKRKCPAMIWDSNRKQVLNLENGRKFMNIFCCFVSSCLHLKFLVVVISKIRSFILKCVRIKLPGWTNDDHLSYNNIHRVFSHRYFMFVDSFFGSRSLI